MSPDAPRSTTDAPSPPRTVPCTHCNLPVPPGLIEPGEEEQFCCASCRTVYHAIRSCGLESFYAIRDRAEAETQRASHADRTYDEFDDEAFVEQHVRTRPDGLSQAELYLEGVHCAACVWLVEKLPSVAEGVVSARLDLRRRVAEITWSPEAISLSRIARRLNGLGYPPHALGGSDAHVLERLETRRHLARIAIAGACAGNAMLAAIAMYAGDASGMADQYRHLLRVVSALIGIIALGWPGSVFFRGAWSAIRTRTPHMDLPIALGLFVGGVTGLINTIRGEGEVYFDSLAVLVLMLLVGRFVQYRQQRRAEERLASLFALTPRRARRVRGDETQDVPVDALMVGEIVEIHAGESVPVDGVVVDGRGGVDTSLMTGESMPVTVGPGDALTAGSVNLESTLRARVEASGDETRLAKIARLVSDAAGEKPRIVQFADRISGWFLAVVTLAALGTFAAWWPIDPTAAAQHATALLIVACPCALGIATPLVLAIAIGRSAQRNIFIKSGHVLELLARPGTIVLDKTGTITEGAMSVTRWWGDASAPAIAAAMERQSTHPVARALAASSDSDVPPADDLKFHPEGVEGTVDGKRVVVGSPVFVGQTCCFGSEAQDQIEQCLAAAQTPTAIGIDGEVVAVAWISDALRTDAKRSIDELRAMGWRTMIASGDQPATVGAIAAALDIDPSHASGRVSPERKLELIRELLGADDSQTVVMVGDGVNDAAALAAASVGLAVHGGAEAALGAADAYFATSGLGRITSLVRAARKTVRTIRTVLAFSLAYNVIGVVLAAAGVIGPLFAALLMPASSFTVIATALAMRTFDD
jgi:Cu2+-exporting ATPase